MIAVELRHFATHFAPYSVMIHLLLNERLTDELVVHRMRGFGRQPCFSEQVREPQEAFAANSVFRLFSFFS